jgi:hypothetical protein
LFFFDIEHIMACCVCVLQIRVFCRVRPHPASAVRCLAGGTSLALSLDGKEHNFAFDKVFGPGTSQQQVSSRLPRSSSWPCMQL